MGNKSRNIFSEVASLFKKDNKPKYKVYVTADLHLFDLYAWNQHASTKNGDRITCGMITEYVITNWNNVVGKDDIVYVIGDIAFKNFADKNPQAVTDVWNKLNGIKYIIPGNHETISFLQYISRFGHYTIMQTERVRIEEPFTNNYYNIEMIHNPKNAAVESKKIDFILHGHLHGNTSKLTDFSKHKDKLYDVGFLLHGRPLELNSVIKIMIERR